MERGWQFPRNSGDLSAAKPSVGFLWHAEERFSLWLCSVLLVILSACRARPTPLTPGPVTFPTDGGLTLAGTLYGNPRNSEGKGELAVILSHGAGGDQSNWQSFAKELPQRGVTVLAFNFRGYYPATGEIDGDAILPDVQAALAFLRQHGYKRAICIGASMGGTACALAASQPGMVGLVLLSGPHQVCGQPSRPSALVMRLTPSCSWPTPPACCLLWRPSPGAV